MLHRPRSYVAAVLLGACGIFGLCIQVAVASGAAAIIDNHLGVLTGRAVAAVKETYLRRAGDDRTFTALVSSASWTAYHADDDYLLVVRVIPPPASGTQAQQAPEWCVFFNVVWAPLPGLRVREVAPANSSAWTIDGSMASKFSDPGPRTLYCDRVLLHRRVQAEGQ